MTEEVTNAPDQGAEKSQPTNAELLAQRDALLKQSTEQGKEQEVPGKSPADASPEVPVTPEVEKPEFTPDNLANTGNPVLDAGIKMMQQVAGLNSADVERIMAKAYERGDASLIDTAYIKERFKEHADYVEQLAGEYIKHTQERVTTVVDEVYKAAGGKEGWELANQTFAAHAPEHLKNAVEALSNSENFTAAAQLVIEFARSSGMVPVPGEHIQGGGAVANGALSQENFRKELSALRKSVGNRSFESGPAKAQYDALVRRRQAGMQRGI